MRKTSPTLILAGLLTLVTLTACGGGGAANQAPHANAGAVQAVASGASVTLNGTGSSDADGSIAAYHWTQTGGTAVSLLNASSAQASFVAPSVTVATTLTFSLVVTDNDGSNSTAASVTITVSPPGVALAGTVRYTRVQIRLSPTPGLDYSNTVDRPARGVVVRALDAATQAVIASGVTSSTGTYSLDVPGNTSITIQVEARLLRDSTQPLPRWNMRVQNGTGTAPTPYRYTTGVINSSSGNGDVTIPLGINTSGVATGVRASGPFAIIDTIYTAVQTAITAMPTANFPTLYVDWGTQTVGAFFTLNSGAHIALRADLTQDTDEFDPPVIAHEFGHYLVNSFSRSDSLGGNHALGDNLDLRVAFNEGFATGFAAIALDNPIYIDTYVNNGVQAAGGYSVETNPATIAPADARGLGCWCNEASIWSLVWDLADSDIDANDGVALGFVPIWQAMLGTQKTTPAFASIFSFIQALKANNPTVAGAIDTLVAAQNIDSATIDDFATTETHAPLPNLLPVYADIARGQSVVVHSTNDAGANANAGDYNKLGGHRFLRYTAQTSGNITVTLTTANPSVDADPDFQIYRAGTLIADASSPSPAPLHNEIASNVPVTAGTTYVIDAYDCANGCYSGPDLPVQGTPGDYDLTVRID